MTLTKNGFLALLPIGAFGPAYQLLNLGEANQSRESLDAILHSPDVLLLTIEKCFHHLDLLRAVICRWGSPTGPTLDMHLPEDGFTPLSVACSIGNIAAVRLLLEQGADPNHYNEGRRGTPLLCACSPGQAEAHCLEIVEILLQSGSNVNVNAQGPFNETALHMACQNGGRPELARLLLKHGANPNCSKEAHAGRTPLVMAVNDTKSFEMAQILLEAGANANVGNSAGWSPLLALCYHPFKYDNPVEWVRLLLQHGADPNAGFNGNSEMTPLSFLVLAFRSNDSSLQSKLVELLIQNGVNPDEEITSGFTSLMLAENNISLVEVLLANGANVNWQKKPWTESALMIAIGNGNLKLARLLLENGANPNLTYHDEKKTLLLMALQGGDVEVIRLLQEFHAELNYKGLEMREEGSTPKKAKFAFAASPAKQSHS